MTDEFGGCVLADAEPTVDRTVDRAGTEEVSGTVVGMVVTAYPGASGRDWDWDPDRGNGVVGGGED